MTVDHDRLCWVRALVFAALWVLVGLAPNKALAQDPSPESAALSEAFERELQPQLDILDPPIDDVWKAANTAREEERHQDAIDLYTSIITIHPDFDHALRRRCGEYLALERYTFAIDDCEAAYQIVPRVENMTSLGIALASAPEALAKPARAKTLARQALAKDPEDLHTAQTVCSIAMSVQDLELMRQCTDTMVLIAPSAWETHLMMSFRHMSAGDLDGARAALDRAHAAGLDDASYEELSAAFSQAEPPLIRWGRRVGLGLLAWIALAAFLAGAGVGLSRLTLAEAESVVTKAAGQASAKAGDSRLHSVYALLLWLCCAYYYVSVPIILALVLLLGGGLLFAIFAFGYIPIKLVLIIVIVVGATCIAILKSFFTRPKDEPPGEALDERDAPGLRKLLDEVAAKVGTRPVDTVYLTPGTDIAVFERGGMLAKLRGKGERCLLLGVAVLDGLDTDALRAILAHEYGHFSNEDTAGGNFALGVRRSVLHTAAGLAEAGAAGWYNPAWVFLRGFHSVFLRISQGASRLQEVLADRWSARTYGAASFERGMRHVIEADLRFAPHANATIAEVLEARRGLRNLYSFEPAERLDTEVDYAKEVEAIIHAEPSPYDSHPRPADRFRWVRALAPNEDEGEKERAPAWSLFEDRGAIEEKMTREICSNVAAQTGVMIPADEEAKARRQRRLGPEDLSG